MTVVHSRPRSRIARSRSAAGMRIIVMCHSIYCRKAKATQVRSTKDAALGDGTIQLVLWGHIGFVALPTARGVAIVPPAALLASVSVDRSARGLGDVHVHGAERAALRVTGRLMTSPIGSEFIYAAHPRSQCGVPFPYPLTLMLSAAP